MTEHGFMIMVLSSKCIWGSLFCGPYFFINMHDEIFHYIFWFLDYFPYLCTIKKNDGFKF